MEVNLGYNFESGFFEMKFLITFYFILLLQAVLSLRKNYFEGLIFPIIATVYAVLLFKGFKLHYPNFEHVNLYFIGVCQFFPVSLLAEHFFTRVIRTQLVQYYQKTVRQKQEQR